MCFTTPDLLGVEFLSDGLVLYGRSQKSHSFYCKKLGLGFGFLFYFLVKFIQASENTFCYLEYDVMKAFSLFPRQLNIITNS